MALNLSSLQKAIQSLKLALDEYQRQDNDLLRDSCILRFKYTYELSWKMLKRHLESTEPASNVIDELSFVGLIRLGNEKGLLLSDWSKWKLYREARNATSHTYDEDKADAVFSVIPGFYNDAHYLLEKLSNFND